MLGEKIQRLRKEKGLSQEQLAAQITVSRQAISKWELGESTPDTDNIVQLCKIFQVSADYLLNDEYQSDGDIPAVKISSDDLKQEYQQKQSKARAIAGWSCLGVGALGVLVIFLLSTIYPTLGEITTRIPGTGVDEYGNILATYYFATGEIFSLGAFLTAHHLEVLFALCCVLCLVGAALLIAKARQGKKRGG